MDKIIEESAYILVECVYAKSYTTDGISILIQKGGIGLTLVNPFADTLEGRRQADAIEDWLRGYRFKLWIGARADGKVDRSAHQWRLDRIKWCIEELIK